MPTNLTTPRNPRGREDRSLEDPVPFRWSRDRYDRLVASGVIDDTHIELIDGELLPIAVTDRDEPEPDVAVVDGPLDAYQHHHPTTADLVVEVSETSLRYDRSHKAVLYARAGIPTYWIVDLVNDCVEVHTDP